VKQQLMVRCRVGLDAGDGCPDRQTRSMYPEQRLAEVVLEFLQSHRNEPRQPRRTRDHVPILGHEAVDLVQRTTVPFARS
jgi:hypothetical protein